MGVVKRIFVMGSASCATDTEALPRPAVSQVEDRVINQIQTTAIAAVILTPALVLWWWAEAARD